MAYTQAQKRATIKYLKSAYDRVEVRIDKGQKQALKDMAAAKGYDGVQPYIIALIEADSGLQLAKPPRDSRE